jgi:hypothetical protein
MPHADPSYVAFANPLDHAWHFALLEVVVFACFALTVVHAARAWREGDRWPAFRWLVIFVYGVIMEMIAFNYWQNYDHGQFTVQLYHRLLPLYVPCIYVVLHVTGIEAVARLKLRALPEALLTGLAICLLDVPFDITGPDAGWWTWSAHDGVVAARWLGVPVTSYYWYMLFGAILAALCRAARKRVEPRGLAIYAAAAVAVAVGVVVLGIIAFLPFHAIHALGVPEDAIVLVHLAGCAVLAVATRPADPAPMPRALAPIPVALPATFLVVMASLVARGSAGDGADGAKKLVAIAAAGLATWWLAAQPRIWRAQRSAAARARVPS